MAAEADTAGVTPGGTTAQPGLKAFHAMGVGVMIVGIVASIIAFAYLPFNSDQITVFVLLGALLLLSDLAQQSIYGEGFLSPGSVPSLPPEPSWEFPRSSCSKRSPRSWATRRAAP